MNASKTTRVTVAVTLDEQERFDFVDGARTFRVQSVTAEWTDGDRGWRPKLYGRRVLKGGALSGIQSSPWNVTWDDIPRQVIKALEAEATS